MDQSIIEGVPGRYWHRLEDGRLQCDLCPRYCKLHEGQRGLCFVRARQNDQILLTTYGRSSGFCIDPIAQAAVRSGCRSVAFTYNDPVIFLEYAVDVAQACRERGIKTVAVSAGYIAPEPRIEFFRHMDAANIDLKGFTEGFYKTLCSGKLDPVLETLEYLKHETDVWFEITTLLIPGENDSSVEIEAESRWVMERLGPDVPLHFTAFHPDWKMTDTPATPPATLKSARRIAMQAGLHYVYTGNIHDGAGQSTYCHGCGATLIGRDWYDLTAWNLSADGRCADCGTACAGVFDTGHGTWGRRRQSITVPAFR